MEAEPAAKLVASSSFRKEGFCGPVTALEWVSVADVLLTGRGTDVLASRLSGSAAAQQPLGTLRLFRHGRIHGIKARAKATSAPGTPAVRILLAAHSEKNVSVAELLVDAPQHALPRAVLASPPPARVLATLWGLDDWVATVQFLHTPGDGLPAAREEEWGFLAVGLAHNTVEIWDWQRKDKLRCVHCVERPVLFTMSLFGDNGDDLLVAVGGFTREVLCWQVLGAQAGRPLQRLKGHTGVIHVVRWRADGLALASGSEDRSMRIWVVAGGDESDAWVGSRMPRLVHAYSVWGHAARLWDIAISADTIVSVSEDCSARVHKYRARAVAVEDGAGRAGQGGEGCGDSGSGMCGQEGAAGSMSALGSGGKQASVLVSGGAGGDGGGREDVVCVSVLKGHQGKHVWKCMLCELAGGGMVVATGGNDSDTKIWDGGAPGAGGAEGGGGDGNGGAGGLEMPVKMESFQVPVYADDDVPGGATCVSVEGGEEGGGGGGGGGGGKRAEREEFVRCCALRELGLQVVCGTNQGRAVRLDRKSGGWDCLYRNSACQFTAIGLDEAAQVAVLGDARGGLSLVSLTGALAGSGHAGMTVPGAHQGHVMDVFFRGSPAVVYSGDNCESAAGGGAIHRWRVEGGALVKLCTIRTGAACRITCLAQMPIDGGEMAVLGDRKGSLALVLLPGERTQAEREAEGELRPICTVHHAHKKNSVTSLTVRDDGLVYSSGRDGSVHGWRVDGARGDGVWRLHKETSAQGWGGLEMIAGVAWERSSQRLLVLGFQHMHFVVCDEPRRARLWRVDCGGARRPYAYDCGALGVAAAEPRDMTLAFVREKRLHVAVVAGGPGEDTVAGAQGREGTDVEPGEGGSGGSWFHGREVHQVMFLPKHEAQPCVHGQESEGGATVAEGRLRGRLLLTASEDGTMKILEVMPRVLAACAGSESVEGDGERWAVELVSRDTIQGERQCQLGAALRCVASVHSGRHGLLVFAGGAKDVLLVSRIPAPGAAGTGGGQGAGSAGAGGHRLLSTHRVPTVKGVMLRYMALAAVEADADMGFEDAEDLVVVVAGADDGLIRLLLYHVARRQWYVGANLHSHHAAILTLCLTTLRGDNGEKHLVLASGACDGQVALWDVTDVLRRVAAAPPFAPCDEADVGAPWREGSPSSLVGRGRHRRPRPAGDHVVEVDATSIWSRVRHQNGVNGVELLANVWGGAPGVADMQGNDTHLLLSVGDDQDIRTMSLGLEVLDGRVVVVGGAEAGQERSVATGVHASTIRDHCVEGSVLVTVGADQRVRAWRLPDLSHIASAFTEVNDASCVDVEEMEDGKTLRVAIGGMGVQVCSLQL